MAKNSKDKLGSGLKALLSNSNIKPKTEDPKEVLDALTGVAMVPIKYIEPNPFQPRTEFDPELLTELVQSIKTYGLIQPITLRRLSDKAFQIISGERRYRASKMAGLKEVPAYIQSIDDDNTVLEMALVENIQRADLNAMEISLTYQRLIDECKINHEILADRVGKKRSTVSNYVRLLKLPPDIQKALKENKLSMGHARALLSLDAQDQLVVVAKEVMSKGLSVRATEALVKEIKASKVKATPKPKAEDTSTPDDAMIVNYRNMISTELGSKVSINRSNNGSGKIVINFNSDDELEDIIEYFDR